jgi:hypothetical protein
MERRGNEIAYLGSYRSFCRLVSMVDAGLLDFANVCNAGTLVAPLITQ